MRALQVQARAAYTESACLQAQKGARGPACGRHSDFNSEEGMILARVRPPGPAPVVAVTMIRPRAASWWKPGDARASYGGGRGLDLLGGTPDAGQCARRRSLVIARRLRVCDWSTALLVRVRSVASPLRLPVELVPRLSSESITFPGGRRCVGRPHASAARVGDSGPIPSEPFFSRRISLRP